jgi:hypothetical protein
MIRKPFHIMAVISMVSLISFFALATTLVPGSNVQDVEAKRGAGARCPLATEIQVDRPTTSGGGQIQGPGVNVTWKVVRKSPSCPIRQLRVSLVVEAAKTQHAAAETLRLEKTVTPGVEKAFFAYPPPKVVIFSASDAKLKITPTVTPIF